MEKKREEKKEKTREEKKREITPIYFSLLWAHSFLPPITFLSLGKSFNQRRKKKKREGKRRKEKQIEEKRRKEKQTDEISLINCTSYELTVTSLPACLTYLSLGNSYNQRVRGPSSQSHSPFTWWFFWSTTPKGILPSCFSFSLFFFAFLFLFPFFNINTDSSLSYWSPHCIWLLTFLFSSSSFELNFWFF